MCTAIGSCILPIVVNMCRLKYAESDGLPKQNNCYWLMTNLLLRQMLVWPEFPRHSLTAPTDSIIKLMVLDNGAVSATILGHGHKAHNPRIDLNERFLVGIKHG